MLDGFRVIALLVVYSILVCLGIAVVGEKIREQEWLDHLDRIERNVGYPQ